MHWRNLGTALCALIRGTVVQVRRHFQQGEFPSSHHREEGWPSDQENTAQHPLFARTGWCSDRPDKEHHPGGVDKEASRHFLGDTAPPPRGDARRGIRFFQHDTSEPHIFSWPLWTRVRTISSKQLRQLCLTRRGMRYPVTVAVPIPNSFFREQRQSPLLIEPRQERCPHFPHTAWKHLQQLRCR